MSPTLLELAQNYFIGSTVRQVSTAFGEPEDRISAALRSAVPLVLGGLLARSQEPGGAAELATWAQQVHKHGLLGDLSGLLQGLSAPAAAVATAPSLPDRGADMLRSLLGADYLPAAAAISQQAGVPTATVRNLLSVVVAVGLGLLGRHLAQHALDADGLRSYLSSQHDAIRNALAPLPGGPGHQAADLAPSAPVAQVAQAAPVASPSPVVAAAAGGTTAAAIPDSPPAPLTGSPAAAAPPEARPVPPRPVPPRPVARAAARAPRAARRWLWLLGLALVALLGYLGVSRRPPQPVAAPAPGPGPVAPAARVAAPTGQYDATTDTYRYDAGPGTTLQLPVGAALTVGSHSAEAQLWQLLTDSPEAQTAALNPGGIVLDRIYFDSGQATLTAASQAQLANLAALLAAFPHAKLKFGGFTDDQGPAEANLLLSADRANAVRSGLLTQGVAPTRVAAQGYGQTHPVASNATPAGRAQNRRVAVLLTSH